MRIMVFHVKEAVKRIYDETYPEANRLVVTDGGMVVTEMNKSSWEAIQREIRARLDLYEKFADHGDGVCHMYIYRDDICMAEHVVYVDGMIRAAITYRFPEINQTTETDVRKVVMEMMAAEDQRRQRGLWKWDVHKCDACGKDTVLAYHKRNPKATKPEDEIEDIPICPSCAAKMLKENILAAAKKHYARGNGTLPKSWDEAKDWLPLAGRAIFYLVGPFPIDISLKTAGLSGFIDDTICYAAQASTMESALCEVYPTQSTTEALEQASKFWVYSLVNLLDDALYRDYYVKEDED